MINQGAAGAATAGDMLAALDALQDLYGARHLSGATDFTMPLPDLASLPILDNLWGSLDLSGPTSLALLAGATAAYAASSGYVTWQGLGNRVASLVKGTAPKRGASNLRQFLNSPFDTFKDQGPILGALALDSYGVINAAELLVETSAEEAAADLKLVGPQAADLFAELALQSPSSAANIIVAVLGPDSPFDDGASEVSAWFKATGPTLAAELMSGPSAFLASDVSAIALARRLEWLPTASSATQALDAWVTRLVGNTASSDADYDKLATVLTTIQTERPNLFVNLVSGLRDASPSQFAGLIHHLAVAAHPALAGVMLNVLTSSEQADVFAQELQTSSLSEVHANLAVPVEERSASSSR